MYGKDNKYDPESYNLFVIDFHCKLNSIPDCRISKAIVIISFFYQIQIAKFAQIFF